MTAQKLPALPEPDYLVPGRRDYTTTSAYSERQMLSAMAQAAREQRERDAKLLDLSASAIRLLAGEMSAAEMRAVRAVLANRAAAIRSQPEPVQEQP